MVTARLSCGTGAEHVFSLPDGQEHMMRDCPSDRGPAFTTSEQTEQPRESGRPVLRGWD